MSFALLCLWISGLVGIVRAGLIDNAIDPTKFQNRRGHSSIVLQNALYIDGGDVAVLNDNNTAINWPFNLTYAIDLSKSWTNSTVAIKSYAKPGSNLYATNLWTDASNRVMYSYNGEVSRANPANDKIDPPASDLWQFSPSSNTWNKLSTSRYDRVAWAPSTCGAGACYVVSGRQTWRTTTSLATNPTTNTLTNNVVIYNTTSQAWSDIPISGLNPTNSNFMGNLVHVPGYGETGLLFMLGGSYSKSTNIFVDPQLMSYDKITIFDPVSGTWSNQSTSGAIPSGRTGGCAVGVSGDNGTYEIFLYGGSQANWATADIESSSDIELASVHVLSIPSFNWQKASFVPTQSRAMHTCNLIGNRQMVVIGGVAVRFSSTLSKDPWTNGLGIFDLTEMKWSDGYDSQAAAYTTPQVVKQYIAQNGQYPKWDNKQVEKWFTMKATNSSTSNTSSSSSSSTSTGTIVGAVVGSILGLLLIAMAAWFFLRHRRKSQSARPPSKEKQQYQYHNLPIYSKPAELNYNPQLELAAEHDGQRYGAPWEMQHVGAGGMRVEKDGVARVELPAEYRR